MQLAMLLWVMSFMEQFIPAFWVCSTDLFIPDGLSVLLMNPFENGVGPVEFREFSPL